MRNDGCAGRCFGVLAAVGEFGAHGDGFAFIGVGEAVALCCCAVNRAVVGIPLVGDAIGGQAVGIGCGRCERLSDFCFAFDGDAAVAKMRTADPGQVGFELGKVFDDHAVAVIGAGRVHDFAVADVDGGVIDVHEKYAAGARSLGVLLGEEEDVAGFVVFFAAVFAVIERDLVFPVHPFELVVGTIRACVALWFVLEVYAPAV